MSYDSHLDNFTRHIALVESWKCTVNFDPLVNCAQRGRIRIKGKEMAEKKVIHEA